jgi:Xaa-Pro aminopeptidase
MNTQPPEGIPLETFAGRRRAVLERLGHGVLLLPGAPIQHTSRDTERPYVPDRELCYLTGWTEPQSVAVLVGGAEPRTLLFVRERDVDAELWSGPRIGPEGARVVTGVDETHPISAMATVLPPLLRGADRLHFRLGRGGPVERLVLDALADARARGPRSGDGPRGVIDPGETLDDLRLVKDAHEIALIRHACAITVDGHREGARTVRGGVGEWEIEAAVNGRFRSSGARGPGFETIVGSGANACVLHYVANRATVPENGLVLIDAGAEWGLYHGDVTRTYPASGRFTARQRDVYDVVEAARAAGVAATRPGETITGVHLAAVRVITEGLISLGILSGGIDELMEQCAYRPFFPHQTSHWLGLDVHDPGDYSRGGVARVLVPGMVLTVEPGLYFRTDAVPGAATSFGGIGVRIEDDVLVTENGCDVLTDLPSAADAVERMVSG